MRATYVVTFITTALAIWVAGCNPSELEPITKSDCQNCNSENGNPNNPGNPGNPGNPEIPVDPWQKIEKDMNGYLKVGNSQAKLISVDKVNKLLTLRVPITGDSFPEIIVEIPEIPGARVASGVDDQGKAFLELQIPIELVLRYIDIGDPQKLPNGDPLPQVPGGELPAVSVNFPIEDVRVHIYLGVEVLGILVEVPFDPHVKVSLPIKTQKNDGTQERTVGYLSSIPKKGQFTGAFFLSLVIPEDIARQLDELL